MRTRAQLITSARDPRDTYDVSADNAEALGCEWPLTVSEGTIWCVGAGRLVFEADGTQYALNGLAKGTGEYADIEAIWLDDPEVDGLKVGIDGLDLARRPGGGRAEGGNRRPDRLGNSVCGY